jgi:hypothetical protein
MAAKKTTTKKKTTKKVSKKVSKKASACHPKNHSGNPELDKYIGFQFQWSEPWEWEEDAIPQDLLDENGEPPSDLDGLWEITSVHEDGQDCWVQFVPTDGDQQMEFPLSLVPDPDDSK